MAQPNRKPSPHPPAPKGDSALDTQVGGAHYKQFAIQPVEFCQRNRLPACETSVVKYVCRHREKGGAQDIRKAIHYLELLLQIDYSEEEPTR